MSEAGQCMHERLILKLSACIQVQFIVQNKDEGQKENRMN